MRAALGKIARATNGLRLAMLVGFALCASSARSAAAFVSENGAEFTTTGDFDGDGRLDIVIVDKVSGNYRLGYQLAAGVYTWATPRSSGIEDLMGFTVGRMLDLTRDALAFTQPSANRVHLVEAGNPNGAGQPLVLYPSGVGPNIALAIEIPSGSPTPYDDLLIESIYDSKIGNSDKRMNVLWLSAGTVTFASSYIQTDMFARPNRVVFQNGQPEWPGLIRRGAASDAFLIHNPGGGFNQPFTTATGLPVGADYVFADFTGSTFRQFVFYKPGDPALIVRPTQKLVNEPYSFGPAVTYPLGQPVRQVFTLPGPNSVKLLVLFGTGENAAVFNFSAINPPTLLESFTAQAGEHFTGAAGLGNHNLILFSASSGSQISGKFQIQNFNGSTYVAGASGSLPAITGLSGRANLFYLDNEAFVSPFPNLLGSVNAGDFTSAFNKPLAQVTTETYAGPAQGLGNPATTSVGQVPASTAFGLVNQLAAAMSAFSFSVPAQADDLDVAISPPPGLYHQSVRLSFRTTGPNAIGNIYYRLDPTNDWTQYVAFFPPYVFKDSTVSYYVGTGGAIPRKSFIHQAAYQFSQPPELLDSDGDGVPDFVEIQKGLDPVKSGKDADSDNFSDLCELLSGTDPKFAGSKPAAPCAQEATPTKVIQGLLFEREPNQIYNCQPGTLMSGHDLNGGLLALGPAQPVILPGVGSPASSLYFVSEVQHRIATVSTEAHFALTIGDPTNRLGRELIALVPLPRVIGGVKVPYVYGDGALATEVANWVAAAQQAYASAVNLTTLGNLEIYDTLVSLLFEAKTQQVLEARGFLEYSNLTLFPFRPGDAGRANPPLSLLLSLEEPSANSAAFRLEDVLAALGHGVSNAPPAVPGLKSVTAEIYRVSSVYNNDTNFPDGWFPPPVNVLRDFLHTGILHSNYLALTTLTAPQLDAAYLSVAGFLDSVPSRPSTNAVLVVRPDSFNGPCTILDLLGGGGANLWHRAGLPYRLLDTFTLSPGSLVQVTGFTDLPNLGCAGFPIEVQALDLLSVPAPPVTDTDNDGLPDALELLLFGNLTQNGSGDFDGDGVSDATEFLQGTDPKDYFNVLFLPGNLPPIEVQLVPNQPGQQNSSLNLSVNVPPQFADQVDVIILATPDLSAEFVDSLLIATNTGGGHFEITLPNPGSESKFFLIQLKPK